MSQDIHVIQIYYMKSVIALYSCSQCVVQCLVLEMTVPHMLYIHVMTDEVRRVH